ARRVRCGPRTGRVPRRAGRRGQRGVRRRTEGAAGMTSPASPASGAPSTPNAGPTRTAPDLSDADIAALSSALSAEDGAIYAYGVATAFARPDRLPQISEHVAAHRARREAVIAMLT